MSNKLFLVASNTQGLKYCKNDAKLMTSCFGEKYNYQVFQPSLQKQEILKELDKLIDNSQKTDTIILYFSGHGIIDERLYFLLADDSSKSSNKLDINGIVDTFETCKAKNKLIILDCCNAELGHETWKPKISNKYFLLTASEFLEEAKELDSKESSFLTYNLVQSLENPSLDILNSDNIIQLQSLYNLLVKRAIEHNNTYADTGNPVPIPNLVGNQKNDFNLVKSNKPQKPFTDDELKDYLHFLTSRCATLDPRHVPRTDKSRNIVLPLEAIFITLKTGQNNPLERDAEQSLLDFEIRELVQTLRLDTSENYLKETDFRYQILQRQFLMQSEEHLKASSIRKNFGTVLTEHRWVVLLGGPGSGKTTLAQWLTLQLGKLMLSNKTRFRISSSQLGLRGSNREVDLGPVRLPIFIRIADYAKKRLEDSSLTLKNFIGHNPILGQHPSISASKVAEICNHFIKNGNALVILDGLDEIIDPADRGEIRDQIERFVVDNIQDPENKEAFIPWTNFDETKIHDRNFAWWKSSNYSLPVESGGNQVIITSRGAGYRAAVLRGEFAHFEIESFDDVSISRFCNRWCLAVERYLNRQAVSPLSDKDIIDLAYKEANSLTEKIFENKGIRKLASNPLLLTILALLHRETSNLPTERTRLYEQAVTALVDRRETNLDKAQVTDFLGPFALWLHENQPTGLATEKELHEQISIGLTRWHGLDSNQPLPGKYKKDIESFIMQAREQSGLIVARGEGLYGFLHLSFQEYFVAMELTRNPYTVINNLQKYLHRPRWVEPLILAIAYLSDTQRGSLEIVLQAITETETPHEDILHRNLLFVANAIANSVWMPPTILHKITSEMLVILADNEGQGRFTLLREQIFEAFETIYRPDSSDIIEAIIQTALLSDSDSRKVAAEIILNVSWASPKILISCHSALSMEGDASIIVDAFNVLVQRVQQPEQYLPKYTFESFYHLYRNDLEVYQAINDFVLPSTSASAFFENWAKIRAPYIIPQLTTLLKTFANSTEKNVPLFEEQLQRSLLDIATNNSGEIFRFAIIALVDVHSIGYATDLVQKNIQSGIKQEECIKLLLTVFDTVLDKPEFLTWLDKQSSSTKQLFLELGSKMNNGWRLGNFAWKQLESLDGNLITPSLKLLVNLTDIKLTPKRLEILEDLAELADSETIEIIGDILEQAKSYNQDDEICRKLYTWLNSSIPALNYYAAFLLGQTTKYFDLAVYNKLSLALRNSNDRWRQWAARVLYKQRPSFSGAEKLIEESAKLDWEEQHVLNDGMASLHHSDFRRGMFFDSFDFIERWVDKYELAATQKEKEIACKILSTVTICSSEFLEALLNKVELSDFESVNECLVESIFHIIANESAIELHYKDYQPRLSDDVLKYAIEVLSKVIQRASNNDAAMYAAEGISLVIRFPNIAFNELCKLLTFKKNDIQVAAIHGLGNLTLHHRGSNTLRKSVVDKLINLEENVSLKLKTTILAALTKSLVISELDPENIIEILMDNCNSDDEFVETIFLTGKGTDLWDNITCDCGSRFHSKLIEVIFIRTARSPLLLERISNHVTIISNLPEDKWPEKRFVLGILAKCAKELPARLNQINNLNALKKSLLIMAVDSSSFSLRRFSLEILGQFRLVNDDIIDVLIAGCRDLGIVQKSSFEAVASIRRVNTNTLPKLLELLSSPSTATVYAASNVMKEIGTSQQALHDQFLRDSIVNGIVDTIRKTTFPRYITVDGKRFGLLDDILFSFLFTLTSDEPLKSNQEPKVLESQLALIGPEQNSLKDQAIQMQKELSEENIHVSDGNHEIIISGDQKILSIAENGQTLEHLLPILNDAIKQSQKLAAKKFQSMTNENTQHDPSSKLEDHNSDTDNNPLKGLGLGNLKELRKQAVQVQKELSEENIHVSDGNHEVIISGDQKILSVAENGQTLEHLLPILNDAIKQSQKLAAKKLQSMTNENTQHDPSSKQEDHNSDTDNNPLKGLGNLKELRKQAVQMQKELSEENIHVSDGNHEIIISGDQKILSVAENGQTLEHLLPILNDAIEQSQKLAAKKLQSMTNENTQHDPSSKQEDHNSDTDNNPLKGLGNLEELRKQAVQMQKALSEENIHVSDDNHEVIISGDQRILSIAENGQTLEHLLPILNDAIKQSQKLAAKKLQSISGRE